MSVALSQPYCTLEDVQKETHNTDDADESYFRQSINVASRMVEDYTHKDFLYHDHSSTAYTVLRRDVIGPNIFLPWPVLTLTEIDERGDNDTTNVIDSDNYSFSSGTRIITCYRDFEKLGWKDTIKLKGTFGYALDTDNPTTAPPPTIPTEVRRATALIAAAFSTENRREVISLDGTRQEVSDHFIPEEAKNLLHRWTKQVV